MAERSKKELEIKDGDIITLRAVKQNDASEIWEINIRDKSTNKESQLAMSGDDELVLSGKGKGATIIVKQTTKSVPVLRNNADNAVAVEGSFTAAAGTQPFVVKKDLASFLSLEGGNGKYTLQVPEKLFTQQGDLQTLTTKATGQRQSERVQLEKDAAVYFDLKEYGQHKFVGGDTEESLKANREKFAKIWEAGKDRLEKSLTNGRPNRVIVEGAPERGFKTEEPVPVKPVKPVKPMPEEKPMTDEGKKAAIAQVKKAADEAIATIDKLITQPPEKGGRSGFFNSPVLGGRETIPGLKATLMDARESASKVVGKDGEIDKQQLKIFHDKMKLADKALGAYTKGPGFNIARENIRPPLQQADKTVDLSEKAYEAEVGPQVKPAPGKHGAGEMNLDAKNPPKADPGKLGQPLRIDATQAVTLGKKVEKQMEKALELDHFKIGPGRESSVTALKELGASAKKLGEGYSATAMANFERSLDRAREILDIHMEDLKNATPFEENKRKAKAPVGDVQRGLERIHTELDELKGIQSEPNKQSGLGLSSAIEKLVKGEGDRLNQVGMSSAERSNFDNKVAVTKMDPNLVGNGKRDLT
jgi:hypothetical protein